MNVFRHLRHAHLSESCSSVNFLYRQYSSLAVEYNRNGPPPSSSQTIHNGLSQVATNEGACKSSIETRGLVQSSVNTRLSQQAFAITRKEGQPSRASTDPSYDALKATGERYIASIGVTEAVSNSSTNDLYAGRLEKEIKRIYGGVRGDLWRSRVLKEICETCLEGYVHINRSRKTTNSISGGSDLDREKRAMAMLHDMQRTEKFIWEDLSFLRSILAAHNSRVDDAIHPDKFERKACVEESHYVFLAIDTEFRKDDVSEVGFATLDTMDITDRNPGPRGKGWFNLVKPYHFLLEHAANERAAKANAKSVDFNFNFGTTKIVTIGDVSRHIRKMVSQWHKSGRRVVLVGQSLNIDLDLLRFNTGFNIVNFSGVSGLLDTYILAQSKNAGSSLNVLYQHFNNEKGSKFHNAGNDAVYCLRTMLMLAMTPQSEWPRPTTHKLVLPDRRGQNAEWSLSDIVSTQGTWAWMQTPDEHAASTDPAVANKSTASDKLRARKKSKTQDKLNPRKAKRQGWNWEHKGKQSYQSKPLGYHSDHDGSFFQDLKSLVHEFTRYLRSFVKK